MKIIKGKTPASWVICIYGVPGIGKSTLATRAEKPVFLDVEGGLDRIDCERTPRLRTWNELFEAMKWASESEYKTVVFDTLLAIEELIIQKIIDEINEDRNPSYQVKTLRDQDKSLAYGAGFEILKSKWSQFAKMLYVIKDMGKNVVCIAHDAVEKVENPSGENYDRYSLNIHKKSVPLVVSKMDAVFFAHFEKTIRSKKNSEKKVAQDTGSRIIQTVEKPWCVAKNRFDLPEHISFTSAEDARKFFGTIK